ncbi:helix-turn-helix domain-containing protein [Streptomyces sp. WMMC500]|uniref:GlxA family transcriptional regulator n=1 Tax=Streptomyces sp. WMMC500 TaxID=3015154 RepID=UPI00248BDFA0|nr:helix-turn-helix domain-containing protein [Streptomyces sp. WMMC500]WBB61797.1 helix-turn-helix domain-containing protein [Streptomyces sp. WMMC500]
MLTPSTARHTVAVLAPPGAVGFDVTAACQAFGIARLPDGTPPYEVRVCGDGPVTTTVAGTASFGLVPSHPLAAALAAGTIVVPGVGRGTAPDPAVPALLRAAHGRGIRVASICTGAFLLAEAGLLDGGRATTHWLAAGQLAAEYPAVRVDPGVLYVDNGQVLTSAGLAAGLDLCLHLISRDHGAAVAARTASALVVPPRREGGMAQVPRRPATAGDPLHATVEWLYRNLHRRLTLADIARRTGVSVRHLHRLFRAQTGTTPLRWLVWARVERARELLETTDLSVEEIARLTGFGSPVSLRTHFCRRVGAPPSAYRRTFRDGQEGRDPPRPRGPRAPGPAAARPAPGTRAAGGGQHLRQSRGVTR